MSPSQEQFPYTTTDQSVIRLLLSDNTQDFLIPAINSLPFDNREILEIISFHITSQIDNIDATLIDILDCEITAADTKLHELSEDNYEFYNEMMCCYDLMSDLHDVLMNAYDLDYEQMDDLLDAILELNTISEDLAHTVRDFIIDLKRVHGYDFDTIKTHIVMDIEYGVYCAYFVIDGLRMRAA